MNSADTLVTPTLKAYARNSSPLTRSSGEAPPRRTAPFNEEPGFHFPAQVWMYGNARLLDGDLAYVEQALGESDHAPDELNEIERITEQLVLAGKVIVTGIHNPAHQRVALVPLRWGAPRIIVFSGGFEQHLGNDLKNEPFRAARLWRYQWDASTDLAISRRAPAKLPTYSLFNPTIDRLIARLGSSDYPGLRWTCNNEVRVLA
ncbi:MAG TPA: hypothetical protein VGL56_04380 [Fimbriimonadaceae bacterium]|jgi:DNA processing protein